MSGFGDDGEGYSNVYIPTEDEIEELEKMGMFIFMNWSAGADPGNDRDCGNVHNPKELLFASTLYYLLATKL